MTESGLDALAARAAADPMLEEALRDAKSPEEFVIIAAGAGVSVEPEDLQRAAMTTLSDAELQGVVGGHSTNVACPSGSPEVPVWC